MSHSEWDRSIFVEAREQRCCRYRAIRGGESGIQFCSLLKLYRRCYSSNAASDIPSIHHAWSAQSSILFAKVLYILLWVLLYVYGGGSRSKNCALHLETQVCDGPWFLWESIAEPQIIPKDLCVLWAGVAMLLSSQSFIGS